MAKLHKDPPPSLNSFHSSYNHAPNPTADSWNMNDWQRSSNIHHKSSLASRTMYYARGQVDPSRKYVTSTAGRSDMGQLIRRPVATMSPQAEISQVNYRNSFHTAFEAAPAPRTDGERYWAYRAIVAEVKLAEQAGQRTDELERMKEELRRQNAFDVAHKYHAERVVRLERLAAGLISTIILITLILLFRHNNHSAEDKTAKRAFRPHLTIPILSPFTSIVEHEESKLGFRTTAAFLAVVGILAYAMFRHWLHQRPR